MNVRHLATPVRVWFLGICLAAPVVAQNVDVAVVINPNNPATNITMAELRKIFAGEKRSWEHGLRIKLIVRSPGSYERLALLKLLGMSEIEYKQYWAAQIFHGDADSEPFASPSIGMQKEAMAVFPGAISLVIAQDVKPGMKVLKVDGRVPGAPGYTVH
jgi:hypothetical protein